MPTIDEFEMTSDRDCTSVKPDHDFLAIICGVLLAVFVLLAVCFVFIQTRHMIRTNDMVEILGKPALVQWETAEGIFDDTPNEFDTGMVTNAPVQTIRTAHGVGKIVEDFDRGGVHFEDTYLVTRRLHNIFGVQVAHAHFNVYSGTISRDGKTYYLQLGNTSGREEGLLLQADGAPLKENRFVVRLREQVETDPPRMCLLEFEVHRDGTISYVGQLTQEQFTSR